MEQRMQKRRRFKQTKPLEVRLAEEAVRLRQAGAITSAWTSARSSRKKSNTDRGCISGD
jgi:hypothetical protein